MKALAKRANAWCPGIVIREKLSFHIELVCESRTFHTCFWFCCLIGHRGQEHVCSVTASCSACFAQVSFEGISALCIGQFSPLFQCCPNVSGGYARTSVAVFLEPLPLPLASTKKDASKTRRRKRQCFTGGETQLWSWCLKAERFWHVSIFVVCWKFDSWPQTLIDQCSCALAQNCQDRPQMQ